VSAAARASFRRCAGIAVAIRLLAPSVKDIRACNLHPDFRKLTEASTGLVIISGPTGSGKSTTLAALIEEINASRARHIVTLESPLEYLFANRQSYIRQREIPTHSPSFEQGITDALRENPDVLVISEMRTPEVMRLTLNAAETGHLVLATMHSANCAEALSRLCMSFPSDLQASVRAQLADCLVGLSCQRLDFLSAHRLRVPRCEILMPSTGARGTIRAGNFSQITNVLQSGGEEGMWTFERYQRWMDQMADWVRPAPDAAPITPANRSRLRGRRPVERPRRPRRQQRLLRRRRRRRAQFARRKRRSTTSSKSLPRTWISRKSPNLRRRSSIASRPSGPTKSAQRSIFCHVARRVDLPANARYHRRAPCAETCRRYAENQRSEAADAGSARIPPARPGRGFARHRTGREGKSDFVFVVDHAGWRIPRRLDDLGLPQSELRRHIAWDIGGLAVASRTAAALDAPLIAQNYSRLVIDCNRDPRSRPRLRRSASGSISRAT
jgi:pilus retraction protein PilT